MDKKDKIDFSKVSNTPADHCRWLLWELISSWSEAKKEKLFELLEVEIKIEKRDQELHGHLENKELRSVNYDYGDDMEEVFDRRHELRKELHGDGVSGGDRDKKQFTMNDIKTIATSEVLGSHDDRNGTNHLKQFRSEQDSRAKSVLMFYHHEIWEALRALTERGEKPIHPHIGRPKRTNKKESNNP